MPRSPGAPHRRGLATASLVTLALALLAIATGTAGTAGSGTGTSTTEPEEAAAPTHAGSASEPAISGEPVLALPTFTVLDDTYNSGLYGSLRTAPDGLPALSYYDDTNGALVYARCLDPACVDATSTVVDDDGVTGLSTSLAYTADGLPVVSYYDLGQGAVRLAWCEDQHCREATSTTVDVAVPDVTRTALTIAPDGRAEVAYASGPSVELAGLSLARCDRRSCDVEDVDGPGIGEYVASARHGDTLALVYRDEAARQLRLAVCGTTCRLHRPDATVGGGLQPVVTFDADGGMLIAHLDLSGRELRLLRCREPTCRDAEVSVLVDTAGAGFFPAIAVRPDGAPTVAYYDEATRALWVATCSDPTCDRVTRHVVDALGIVGLHTSITLARDGAPVIAYHDQTNRHLKVVACATTTCAAPTEAATLGRGVVTFVDGDGRPAVVYRSPRPRDIRMAACVDVACSRTTVVPADERAFVGLHGSGSSAADGSAVVTFYDVGAADLRLGTCAEAPCSYLQARDLDTDGNVGAFAAQSLTDGRLAVAYLDRSRGAVRLLTCTAPRCDDDEVTTLADVPAGSGELAVGHRGAGPLVVRQDPGTGQLVLATCRDAGCRAHDERVLADGTSPLPIQLEVAADGRLWVLHRDAASGALRLATCAAPTCDDVRTLDLAAGGVEASLTLVGDRPVVAFLADGRGLVVARCEDTTCGSTDEVVLSTRVGLATSVRAGSSGELLVGTLELGSGDPLLLRCPDDRCAEVEHLHLLVRARS